MVEIAFFAAAFPNFWVVRSSSAVRAGFFRGAPTLAVVLAHGAVRAGVLSDLAVVLALGAARDPQMQGALSSALFGADPSVILQAGVVRVQMHVL